MSIDRLGGKIALEAILDANALSDVAKGKPKEMNALRAVLVGQFEIITREATLPNARGDASALSNAAKGKPKACFPKVCSGFGIKDTRKQIDKADRVNTIERDML